MASIDDIIRREVNPFDPTTFKPGNFWREKQDSALTVDSIHQEAIAEIEALLNLVAKDHRSRTVLVTGDSGSGKSYLLGRIKRTLNPKAFFAYIGAWADNDHIRRHILRYTVDSLMQFPEGQQESQLMLWLKSLSAFTKRNLKQRIFDDNVWTLLQSDRKNFINHLKKTYRQANIYNADQFFGVLHDLTNPDLYHLACEWLRGDDLSEESLQALKVRKSIETEEAAWETLSNLGRISTETQPMVLCFDQIDNPIASDPQPFFSINTTIHNDSLKNFLVIISLPTNNWRQSSHRIQMSDKAGIHKEINLKRIGLDQAEALWRYRLQPIHEQANPKNPSPIFPLTRQALEAKFPGGKTDPRNALMLGGQLFDDYKRKLGPDSQPDPDSKPNSLAAFKLLWQHEYNKIQSKITKITLLSTPELIAMLAEVLDALEVKEIKAKLLSGKYTSYSLSYQQPEQKTRVGVVWTEDASMTSFYNIMNACQAVINKNSCQTLYLIRAAGVGNGKLAGHQIYRQIFQGSQNHHIKATLSSVHYLATYKSLVNSAQANELVVAGKMVELKELQDLIRQSEILNKCTLLQELKIVQKKMEGADNINFKEVEEHLLNLVKTQSFMGKPTLIQNTLNQLLDVNQFQVEEAINRLINNNKVKIINPNLPPKEQLICFVPQT
ncbi:MAG TPA: ATP-binding protein [Leptolyngbyaceae cyanobacterium]